ncbi:Protein S-acyltransferase [Vigna angularis]|uniref:S-acyltransferase n=1 Tax=Phaseolus angularis TaxID=3914 RepID=A0A8T0KW45_PHAAN|nr:Protein S-acyltransferase [Vigna angularis]
MRRHGWQRPLHPLQFVGAAVYAFLVVCFYTFLGLFLGNRTAELTLTLAFSVVATSVMFLFVRCTAIDPTDRTSFKKKKKKKRGTLNATPKLNYGFILGQIVIRFFRRVERKLLRTFIKRKYLDPLKTSPQMEPLLPFPLVMKDDDDAVAPSLKEDDISFCALCDFEVKKHSKHCRTCNRCVEGFDHHCRWLNNCVGKRNYTTFFLLMIFVLLMLLIEGGAAIAIFIRCFVDKRGIEKELQSKLHIEFPRGVLATICVLLLLLTAYSTAALGQLFFFHVLLIRKGMRTYDYILAMREENEAMELESLDDSDFSSEESFDFDSPEKPTLMSKFLCKGNQGSPSRFTWDIRSLRGSQASGETRAEYPSTNPFYYWELRKFNALLAVKDAGDRGEKEAPQVASPRNSVFLEVKVTITIDPRITASLSNHSVRWLMRSKLPVNHLPAGTKSLAPPFNTDQITQRRRQFQRFPILVRKTLAMDVEARKEQENRFFFHLVLNEPHLEVNCFIKLNKLGSSFPSFASTACHSH